MRIIMMKIYIVQLASWTMNDEPWTMTDWNGGNGGIILPSDGNVARWPELDSSLKNDNIYKVMHKKRAATS